MRNVFDQYKEPENRLTHALATVLCEDRQLLRDFIYWITGRRFSKKASLYVVEQSLPGELIVDDREGDAGLPDLWLYDDDGWCLLVESKIQDRLKTDQLRRHYKTAERRGFVDISVLALEADPTEFSLPNFVVRRLWSDVYIWLKQHISEHGWAARAADYFEIAERRLVQEEYLRRGHLTVFTGIPFCSKYPYNYLEAKRLIRLMMKELHGDSDLLEKLNLDAKNSGRPAITGKDGTAVWDYMSLKESGSQAFNEYPHFNVAISWQQLGAHLMLPNKMASSVRRKFNSLTFEEFFGIIEDINNQMESVLRVEPYARPRITVTQRRFPSQKAKPFVDAVIDLDIRTAISSKNSKVKIQSEWVRRPMIRLQTSDQILKWGLAAYFPTTIALV